MNESIYNIICSEGEFNVIIKAPDFIDLEQIKEVSRGYKSNILETEYDSLEEALENELEGIEILELELIEIL